MILSVLIKKTDRGKNSFVEDADTQTQGQQDSQNSIWEGTDSVSNNRETGKEKMQEERSKKDLNLDILFVKLLQDEVFLILFFFNVTLKLHW